MHFLHDWLWQAIYLPIEVAGAIFTVFSLLSKLLPELFPKTSPKKTSAKTPKERSKMTLWQRVLHVSARNLFLVFAILLLIGGLSGASFNMYNKLQNTITTLQSNITNLQNEAGFRLAFDTVTVSVGRSPEGVSLVTVGIELQNTSTELIQYKLIDFKVILGGKTVGNYTFPNTSVYVFPGKTSDYFYPTIEGIDLTKQSSGTLEYEVHYSSVPDKYWYMSRRKLALDLVITDSATLQSQITWRALEEEESLISQP